MVELHGEMENLKEMITLLELYLWELYHFMDLLEVII